VIVGAMSGSPPDSGRRLSGQASTGLVSADLGVDLRQTRGMARPFMATVDSTAAMFAPGARRAVGIRGPSYRRWSSI
jgi:hypothetical protein